DQLEDGAVAVLQPVLAHQALGGVVPGVDADLAGEAVVVGVLELAGDADLLRADELQPAGQVAAAVGAQQRGDAVAELGVGQVPVAGEPDLARHHALQVVDPDAQLVALGDGGDHVALAVVVAGAVEALQPAVLPDLPAAVGIDVGDEDDPDLDVGVA